MTARGTRGDLRAEMLGILVSMARGQLGGRNASVRLAAATRVIAALDAAKGADAEEAPLTVEEARAVLAADPTIRALVLADKDIRTEVQ